ncbi:MAG: hypothetical protein JXX29_03410 [Deltaproteobacteria bacterium]|nr:hypothetical protein [Deltaproteobacteria bacterium]MBN2670690.1 hypothetical protein [Deltaproteobacteria bacterium]
MGTEINVSVPPPVLKPLTPKVKVRNRTPLPMPDLSQIAENDAEDNSF